jgi:hypothetical protein
MASIQDEIRDGSVQAFDKSDNGNLRLASRRDAMITKKEGFYTPIEKAMSFL